MFRKPGQGPAVDPDRQGRRTTIPSASPDPPSEAPQTASAESPSAESPSSDVADADGSPQTDVREALIQVQKKKHGRRRTRRAVKKAAAKQKREPAQGPPVNRNRIPIIREDADLYAVFGLKEPAETDRDVFEKMMADALSETDMAAVMAEKDAGRRSERPLSLKARLSAYPPPQEMLDLHDCTAADAISKVESFVQTSRGRGLKTVKVIVGKGLHSEGAAVLPRIVPVQLGRMKHRQLVLEYRWEKDARSKSGALIVYLR